MLAQAESSCHDPVSKPDEIKLAIGVRQHVHHRANVLRASDLVGRERAA